MQDLGGLTFTRKLTAFFLKIAGWKIIFLLKYCRNGDLLNFRRSNFPPHCRFCFLSGTRVPIPSKGSNENEYGVELAANLRIGKEHLEICGFLDDSGRMPDFSKTNDFAFCHFYI